MKCALELQAISAVRAEEIRQSGIQKTKKEAEEIKKRTIRFCEALGKELEQEAEAGRKPKVVFFFDYSWESKYLGRAMESTTKDYADGRVSYRPVGGSINLQEMANWFDKYCFAVKTYEDFVWRYGWGQTKVFLVTIEPAKKCTK